jgi:hypothetical protein
MHELTDYYLNLDETYSQAATASRFVNEHATWKYIPYIWVVANGPDGRATWINTDPFLSAVHARFGGWTDFYLTKPRHAHSWHTDAAEQVSINMVFEEYNSLTLFSVENPQPDIHNFAELKYRPNQWTIINTAKKHTVLNLENRNRYLMCYRPPGGTSYQTVVDWYRNEYLK